MSLPYSYFVLHTMTCFLCFCAFLVFLSLRFESVLIVAVFTDRSQPGAVFRVHFDTLMAALRLPVGVAGSRAAEEAGLGGGDTWQILPSFFHMLTELKRRGYESMYNVQCSVY